MSVQSAGAVQTVATGDIHDARIAPDGKSVFVAVADTLTRYDFTNGAKLGSWKLGVNLGGMDISPDGANLFIVDRRSVPDRLPVYYVDLTTSQSIEFNFLNVSGAYSAYDVAFISNTKIVLTTNTYDFLKVFDLQDRQLLFVPSSPVITRGVLTPSLDHSITLIGSLETAEAPLHLYVDGAFTAGHNVPLDGQDETDGVKGYAAGFQAISPDKAWVVQVERLKTGSDSKVNLYDGALHYVLNLSERYPEYADIVMGVTFSADGRSLYLLDGVHDRLFELAAGSWTLNRVFTLGVDVATSGTLSDGYGDRLTTSPDGSHLLIMGDKAVYKVDLSLLVAEKVTMGADVVTGTFDVDYLDGLAGDDVLDGAGGSDTIVGGRGDDTLTGGAGDDILDGGEGNDRALYTGDASSYAIRMTSSGWTVADLRAGAPEGSDTLSNIETLVFGHQSIDLSIARQANYILRGDVSARPGGVAEVVDLSNRFAAGELTAAGVTGELVKHAGATTSVALLAYQFFTGRIPSQAGIDYLVAPGGANANTLNSAYYQSFNLENRYINFAVNLGKVGEGAAGFLTGYGQLSLIDSTRKAYQAIFGALPTLDKAHQLIDSRVDYFAAYGGDGPNGIGTKAAMVGWLLAEAEKAYAGVMARSADAWLTDLADGSAPYAIDILDAAKGYWKADFVFGG